MKCNLIGAGKLGKQITKSFINASLIQLQAVCTQSLKSAQQAVDLLGQGKAVHSIHELPNCEVLFLAVPDDQIKMTCQQLRSWPNLHQVKTIIHFSGALSSDVLRALQSHQQNIASLHPLKSFALLPLEENTLEQVDCVIEGDREALQWVRCCLDQLNARPHPISADKKGLYHAAASISANYLTTLADISHQLFLDAGISEENIPEMIGSLMQSCIQNFLQKKRPIEALTGPLIREDHQTLRLHCESIEDPLLLKTYLNLAMTTAVRAGFSEQSMKMLTFCLQPFFVTLTPLLNINAV